MEEKILDTIFNRNILEELLETYGEATGNKVDFKESNVYRLQKALAQANGDAEKVKTYIKNEANNFADFKALMTNYIKGFNTFDIVNAYQGRTFKEIFGDKTEPTKDNQKPMQNTSFNFAAEFEKFREEMANKIDADLEDKFNALGGRIQKGVSEDVVSYFKDRIVEKREITVINSKDIMKANPEEKFHEKFEEVLQLVANNIPVYLYGPSGSGKNVIAEQVAKALNIGFGYMGPVTSVYDLLGYQDANGNFKPTECSKAATEGKLFFKDELDGDVPEAVIALNSLLSNGYVTFPGVGTIQAHNDFRCIAAGNTNGRGATVQYGARSKFDGATADRFAMIYIYYDKQIELKVSGNDLDLVDFIDEFRRCSENASIEIICSYRSIDRIAKMKTILGIKRALDTCLIKGLDIDSLNTIISLYNDKYKNNPYFTALTELAGM